MKIKLQQIRSPIGRHHQQRQTLIGLGLNRLGRVAYVPDTPETHGMIAKVHHLVRVTLRVTFDSNTWQPLVRPDKFAKDPRHSLFLKINQALKDGRIQGFLSEVVASLEGISRNDRGKHFSGRNPHPGLAAVLTDRLNEARSLGFYLMRSPRIALGIPVGLDHLYVAEANDEERGARQIRTFAAMRAIEARGVGKAQIEVIGQRIASRLSLSGPWHKFLDRPLDAKENDEIADAIGEWADGDGLAAHVGYGSDFFCSEDFGVGASKTAGSSILTPSNRTWLSKKLGIQFLTITELAGKL